MTSVLLLILYGCAMAAMTSTTARLGRRFDRRSLALLAVLPLVFLSPGVFRDLTPVATDHLPAYVPPWQSPNAAAPHNATLSDFASQFVPWARAVRLSWKKGSIPFLNQWNGSGTALAANGSSAPFSPFTIAMFALPLGRAYVLAGLLKLFLALTGAYLWLSELGVSKPAARFGAVTFGLSFALTPWLHHPAAAGIALWPWVLFAVEYREPSHRRIGFWLLVALLVVWPLGGHLETVALAVVFTTLWLVFRAASRDVPFSHLARLAWAGALALGLSMVVLAPQGYAILASNRLALARDPNHLQYVPWVPYQPGWTGALVTSLFPRAFGDAVSSLMVRGAAGSIVEMGFGYIGLAAWSLVLLTKVRETHRAKQRTLLLLLLVGLGVAMGFGVFRRAADLLPGLALAPPLRWLLFLGVAGSALAAFSLDGLLSEPRRNAGARIAACAVGLATLAGIVYWRLAPLHQVAGGLPSQRQGLYANLAVCVALAAAGVFFARPSGMSGGALAAAMTLIAAGQLSYEGMRLYRYYSPATMYPTTPLLAFLRSQPGVHRVVGADTALFPNTNVMAGLEDIRTHDPIERRDYTELLDATCGYPPFEYAKRIQDLNAPVLDFLNVRYLVAAAGYSAPGSKWRPVYQGMDGTAFENTRVMPRFTVPPRIEVVPSRSHGQASRHALDAFGPPLKIYLAGDEYRERAIALADPEAGLDVTTLRQDPASRVSVVARTTNTFSLDVIAGSTAPRTVVVGSVLQDGGWVATDERGRRIPVTRANGPFLGLVVPRGQHRISLSYRPPGLSLGMLLTGVAGAAAVATAFAQSRRAPRES